MLTAETNKYLIRETEENDYEKVKELVMGNEYLALLWGAEYRTEERLEQARNCVQMDFPLPINTVKLEEYLKDIVEKETGVRPNFISRTLSGLSRYHLPGQNSAR